MADAIAKLLLKTNIQMKYILLTPSLVSCLLESASECCLPANSRTDNVRIKILKWLFYSCINVPMPVSVSILYLLPKELRICSVIQCPWKKGVIETVSVILGLEPLYKSKSCSPVGLSKKLTEISYQQPLTESLLVLSAWH